MSLKSYNIRENLWLSNNQSDIFGCLGNTYEDITQHCGVLRTVAFKECCQRTNFETLEDLQCMFNKKVNIMFKVDFAHDSAYIAFKVLIQLDDDEHG